MMARILIVDDDAAIGDMLEELLTREGYAVSRAFPSGSPWTPPAPPLAWASPSPAP